MLVPASKELFLWTVTEWLSRNGPHGHEFSIWVSPLFLKTAARVEYDEEKLQEFAYEIARASGIYVSKGQRILAFGEWGLERIDLLSGGKWFSLELQPREIVLQSGGQWSCHNIDHVCEQSLLMCIWVAWANFVEAEVNASPDNRE